MWQASYGHGATRSVAPPSRCVGGHIAHKYGHMATHLRSRSRLRGCAAVDQLAELDLDQQAQLVIDVPFVDDLAVLPMVMAHAHNLHTLAGWVPQLAQNAIAQVMTLHDPAHGNLGAALLAGVGG